MQFPPFLYLRSTVTFTINDNIDHIYRYQHKQSKSDLLKMKIYEMLLYLNKNNVRTNRTKALTELILMIIIQQSNNIVTWILRDILFSHQMNTNQH